jgi:hypothetical protein
MTALHRANLALWAAFHTDGETARRWRTVADAWLRAITSPSAAVHAEELEARLHGDPG